jgi:acyl-CoA thioesterase FadM
VSVESVGPASFALDYEVTRDGLLLVSGWTRLAVCERDFGRAMPTPDWLRDLFERIPATAEGTR